MILKLVTSSRKVVAIMRFLICPRYEFEKRLTLSWIRLTAHWSIWKKKVFWSLPSFDTLLSCLSDHHG